MSACFAPRYQNAMDLDVLQAGRLDAYPCTPWPWPSCNAHTVTNMCETDHEESAHFEDGGDKANATLICKDKHTYNVRRWSFSNRGGNVYKLYKFLQSGRQFLQVIQVSPIGAAMSFRLALSRASSCSCVPSSEATLLSPRPRSRAFPTTLCRKPSNTASPRHSFDKEV